MIVHIDKLIRHLKRQIAEAEKVSSAFVYITVREAEGCLELAEAEETIMEQAKPVPAEGEGDRWTWYYVCGECHTCIDTRDKYCRECGRRIKW